MATIRFFLDTRRHRKDGRCQLKVALNHEGRTTYIPTGLSLLLDQWDKHTEMVISSDRKLLIAFNNVRIRMLTANGEIIALMSDGRHHSLDELRHTVMLSAFPDDSPKPQPFKGLKDGFECFISGKEGRTRKIYATTFNRISEFAGKAFPSLSYEAVDNEWLCLFDEFLAKNAPKANARAIHMRNLRAVFNFAITNGLTSWYPFRRFKIRHEPTPKRSIGVTALKKVLTTPLDGLWFEKYRDFFALSFYLIGINTVDLLNAKEITDEGRIDYIRAKTHKPYSVKVEKEALEIIDKYRGKDFMLCFMDGRSRYQSFSGNLCRGLDACVKYLNGIKNDIPIKDITTYWARHTWATIAASLDIPKETIAAALGHGGNSVTDIYINFDTKKVDEANRKVIDYVLYGKK